MEKKNIIIFSILLTLFLIDVIKVKIYPEPVLIKPTTQNDKNTSNAVKDINLDNIKEEDLKLEEEEDINNNKGDENKSVEKADKNNISNTKYDSDKIVINIKHCSTYSTKVADFKKELLGTLANVEINESVYPATSEKQLISKVLGYLQFAFIAVMIGGQTVRNSLSGIIPAAVFNFIESKKLMIGVVVYFGVSYAQNMLSQTGAFEVSVLMNNNDENIYDNLNNVEGDNNFQLIWSTLQNKSILPTVEDIISRLKDLGIVNKSD